MGASESFDRLGASMKLCEMVMKSYSDPKQTLQAKFEAADKNKDGELTLDELKAFMKSVELPEDLAEPSMLIFDQDGNGVITFDEFQQIMFGLPQILPKFDLFGGKIFESLDKDKDGKLNLDEIKVFLRVTGSGENVESDYNSILEEYKLAYGVDATKLTYKQLMIRTWKDERHKIKVFSDDYSNEYSDEYPDFSDDSSDDYETLPEKKKRKLLGLCFKDFDEDEDGLLNKAELEDAIKDMFPEVLMNSIPFLFDLGHKGGLDKYAFAEFVRITEISQNPINEILHMVFQEFDKDHDGFLVLDEFVEFVKVFVPQKPVKQIKESFYNTKKCEEEKISFEAIEKDFTPTISE
ncbi:hypothetical protein TRFO_01991 [Tritrichomonas foetus]|uniref:EF-hand domain-containing protein n=1 Tax=Tritrichomonas foetus TaxID=1144522 RepID=A0A1J4JCJ1_9EUKA|nr:hypothetical protein TRFO_01991 [Tritrichomonas foetus]|eukprot:OHS96894.1 hypothetical protein TRFO_01991 [Tritrichomonas foetus]